MAAVCRIPILLGLTQALLLAAPADAQTTIPVVDPPLFEFLRGARTTSFPFGNPQQPAVRHLEVRDGLRGKARKIGEIAWRRSFGSSSRVAGFDAICTLRLSTAPIVAAKLSATFAKNHGQDQSTVVNAKKVSFATSTPASGKLPKFEYAIPFPTPFSFAGTGSLTVDLVVASNTNTTPFTFDLYQEGRAYHAAFGSACGGTDLATTIAQAKVTHDATGLPKDAPLLFLAGLPLAKPLDLKSWGAPGCTNYVSYPIVLPGFADKSGGYSVSFATTTAKAGQAYSCQILAVDPSANKFGAVLTQAQVVLPIAARSTGRVFATSATATSGTAQPVFGLVERFR